jgi:hypothetical protein
MLVRNKTNELKKILDGDNQEGLDTASIVVAIFSAIILLVLAVEIVLKVYRNRNQVTRENNSPSSR